MRFIEEASFLNFRCYGRSSERMELKDFNIIAGPNNAGKSALLLALRRLVTTNINRHPPIQVRTEIGLLASGASDLRIEGRDYRDGAEKCEFRLKFGEDLKRCWEVIMPWISGERGEPDEIHGYPSWPQSIKVEFTPKGYPDIIGDELQPGRMELGIILLERLPIVTIPERRSLALPMSMSSPGAVPGFDEEMVTAEHLLPVLLHWFFEDKARFEKFRDTASDILGVKVTIDFRPSQSSLLVGLGDESPRPVYDLGAGITSILVPCLALAKYGGGLLLYEEPELHLHPRLQRRLVQRLRDESATGPWQMVLTTHSNHVLDLEPGASDTGCSIFLITKMADGSRIESVSAELRQAIFALGARPSSLSEANVIIWMEGPSDAVYLRLFIDLAARKHNKVLREYADFAFAFYGGSNLRHHGLTSAPMPGLIDMLTIHPAAYVVVDSDLVSHSEQVSGKKYTRDFIERSNYRDRIWVTAGREMENYLHRKALAWAFAVDEDGFPSQDELQWRDLAQPDEITPGAIAPMRKLWNETKVAFATAVVEYMRTRDDINWLDCLDLQERMDVLVRLILEHADRPLDPC